MRHTLTARTLAAILIVVIALTSALPALAARKKKKTPEETLAASVKREIEIGDKVAEEIAKHMNIIEDPFVTARIKTIFNRLTPWVTRPLPYNVQIVREKSPNAFCIPGGNIYVTTGLIDFAQSDSELAFVIAHELAHADGKHVIIQMERNQRLSLAAIAIALASRGAGAAMVLSNVAAIAVASAYSRDLEQQADLGAIEIAEKAGYDLVAGVTSMESLAAEELKQPWIDPGVYRDHPKLSDRISYIADAVERKGYRIHRKKVLKLLIPRIAEEKGCLTLTLDNAPIISGPATDAFRTTLETAKKNIETSLQMETPAYDIRIDKTGPHPAICVGVVRLLKWPIPGVTDTPETVRTRIVDVLDVARKKHPMARYAM